MIMKALVEKQALLIKAAPRLFADAEKTNLLLSALTDWLVLHIDELCAHGTIACIVTSRGIGGEFSTVGKSTKQHTTSSKKKARALIPSASAGARALRDGTCHENVVGRGKLLYTAANENLHKVKAVPAYDGRGTMISYATRWVYDVGVWACRRYEASEFSGTFSEWLESSVLISKVPAEGATDSEEDVLISQGLLPELVGEMQQNVSGRAQFTSYWGAGAGRTNARKLVLAMSKLSAASWKRAKKSRVCLLRLTLGQTARVIADGRVAICAASFLRLVRRYPLAARLPGNPDHDRVILLAGQQLDELAAEWRRRVWAQDADRASNASPYYIK